MVGGLTMNDKESRCEKANELIKLIATRGRKFCNYEDRTDRNGHISYFKLINNRVYYVDGFTHKAIYAYHYRHFKRYFSEGGTLQALMQDLSLYIRTGKATNGTNGYGGVYCQAWGYREDDLAEIRAKAVEIGFSK